MGDDDHNHVYQMNMNAKHATQRENSFRLATSGNEFTGQPKDWLTWDFTVGMPHALKLKEFSIYGFNFLCLSNVSAFFQYLP